MTLYCAEHMCDCFLTQKVPDNTCRPSRDEDDDEDDEANQPFREAPPFMGRIRIGARFLCINTNIHIFFSNNFPVLVVQCLYECYLRGTCGSLTVLVSQSWFGSAVNPFPSSIIARAVISGPSSVPSVLIRVVVLHDSESAHVRFFTHVLRETLVFVSPKSVADQ